MKAIGESTGRTLANLKKDYKDVGDLGELAKVSTANLTRPSQILNPVFCRNRERRNLHYTSPRL